MRSYCDGLAGFLESPGRDIFFTSRYIHKTPFEHSKRADSLNIALQTEENLK